MRESCSARLTNPSSDCFQYHVRGRKGLVMLSRFLSASGMQKVTRMVLLSRYGGCIPRSKRDNSQCSITPDCGYKRWSTNREPPRAYTQPEEMLPCRNCSLGGQTFWFKKRYSTPLILRRPAHQTLSFSVNTRHIPFVNKLYPVTLTQSHVTVANQIVAHKSYRASPDPSFPVCVIESNLHWGWLVSPSTTLTRRAGESVVTLTF